jgi:hypothetical protein
MRRNLAIVGTGGQYHHREEHSMNRQMTSLLLMIFYVALLAGCSSFPTISHLRQQNGELTYDECKVTVLNTLLLGIYAWSSDCQEKTLKLK